MAGTWVASVTRIVHTMAIGGCSGDGGLSVASGYLTSLTAMMAKRDPPYAKLYDKKLRRLATSTEDTTAMKVAALFHSADANVVAEVLVDLNLDKPKSVQPQQPSRQRPSGGGRGGPPASGDKRARDDTVPMPRIVPQRGQGQGRQSEWSPW